MVGRPADRSQSDQRFGPYQYDLISMTYGVVVSPQIKLVGCPKIQQ